MHNLCQSLTFDFLNILAFIEHSYRQHTTQRGDISYFLRRVVLLASEHEDEREVWLIFVCNLK